MSQGQDVRAYSLIQLPLICFLNTSAMWLSEPVTRSFLCVTTYLHPPESFPSVTESHNKLFSTKFFIFYIVTEKYNSVRRKAMNTDCDAALSGIIQLWCHNLYRLLINWKWLHS